MFLLGLNIVKRHPDDRADIRDFATAEDLFGRVLLEVGNLEPAEQMFAEALKYRCSLFEDEPGDAHAAYLYGIALWHMARLERAKANTASEAEWTRQARDHLIWVNEAWPGSAYITEALSEVEERLGQM